MPETRLERGVFVLGVLAIAALAFLVVHLWHNRDATNPPRAETPTTLVRTAPAERTTATTATTAKTTRTKSTTPARTTTSTATRRTTTAVAATKTVSLALTARVDSWLEVRSASSTGALLYSGTLASGSTRTFHARSLWLRFGAAGNLSARLDGNPVDLPSGTYDATVDGRHGLRLQRG